MRTRDNNYIPDILETIANLSNDEVFTPPKLANDILDLLPKEIWKDSTVTFLDPAVKTGIFLREIARRLIEGLADEIPDLQKRVNHILTKQVFGLAITELTSLMARRTVYCAMEANSPHSVCTEFTDAIGNIKFPDTKHSWNEKTGRCEACGASRESYDRGESRESYAYPFLHNFNIKETFGDMKFDVIIGNPPYQLSDGGGTGDSAVPLYNKFIDKAKELNPKYISMIVPSKWMKGGKGLDSFRKDMMRDKRIKVIVDYQNAKDVFPTINLDGGVNYFLWDKAYNGIVEYTYYAIDGSRHCSKRFLESNFSSNVVRDPRQISILEKIKSNKSFDSIVSSRNPFGFGSDFFNNPEKYSEIEKSMVHKNGFCKIYGVVGNKGGAKRISSFVKIENKGQIKTYKLFFSKAYTTTATVPPKIIKGEPGTLCTETFLKIGNFSTEKEMDNCLSYIETKFFRALLFYNRHSLNISKSSFSLIPLQDFSKPWTDKELYKKYGLTEEEIAYIEENIAPMTDDTTVSEDTLEEYLDSLDESELEEEE
jgi:site-specific DNA-methyltransferase (adenine-specific)